jgi:hypothetical protein
VVHHRSTAFRFTGRADAAPSRRFGNGPLSDRDLVATLLAGEPMPLERDLMDALVDAPPETSTTLSDWLRELDLAQLADIARAARLAGDSFGRYLRHEE